MSLRANRQWDIENIFEGRAKGEDMTQTPAYDPIDSRYWDERDLRSEVERVFKLCADCRLCNKFCGSFPKLFDAIDSYCTEEPYATVDSTKLKTEDVRTVVALCFQCKLCDINCPYTPGNHAWAIDSTRSKFWRKVIGANRLLARIGRANSNPDSVDPLVPWSAAACLAHAHETLCATGRITTCADGSAISSGDGD
jgi:Fe-S oxidoreductase